jgi:Phage Tail Collar Domain
MLPVNSSGSVQGSQPPRTNSTNLFSQGSFFTNTVSEDGTSTVVNADFMNDVQQELLNTIVGGGVAPSTAQNNLLTAIQNIVAAAANPNNPGEIRAYAGTTPPTNWMFPFGQQVPRASFTQLFSVIGTTYGAGNGTTTFNLPDLRGKFLAGLDNMGGTAAGLITQAVSGVNSESLGATGGSQSLQSHTHAVTDPGHVHAVRDPGHAHGVADPGHVHGVGDPGHAHALPANPDGSNNDTGVLTATGLPDADGSAGSTEVSGTGIFIGAALTGIGIDGAVTGVGIDAAVTGITNQTFGAGNSQNIPPVMMINYIIYMGTF